MPRYADSALLLYAASLLLFFLPPVGKPHVGARGEAFYRALSFEGQRTLSANALGAAPAVLVVHVAGGCLWLLSVLASFRRPSPLGFRHRTWGYLVALGSTTTAVTAPVVLATSFAGATHAELTLGILLSSGASVMSVVSCAMAVGASRAAAGKGGARRRARYVRLHKACALVNRALCEGSVITRPLFCALKALGVSPGAGGFPTFWLGVAIVSWSLAFLRAAPGLRGLY